MGGSNDSTNLVDLTAREHFICHMLLVEIYPGNEKLVYAAWRMIHGYNQSNRNKTTSRMYEYYKHNLKHSADTKLKISNALTGKKQSIDTIRRRVTANTGKLRTDATKQKIRDAHVGKIVSDVTREKLSKAASNRIVDEATKQKQSDSLKGRTFSNETKTRMSTAKLGKPSKIKGIIKPDVVRERISLAKRGKPQRKVTCSVCQKTGGVSNMTKYHFDNCKQKITK